LGQIHRAGYDGSGTQVIFDNSHMPPGAPSLYTGEIAVDPVRGMMYWYNPVMHVIQSATTDGVIVSTDLLGQQIQLVEGLAIDYAIPEPSTALLALPLPLIFWLAAFRRSAGRHTATSG
jgi:hypothetical protein